MSIKQILFNTEMVRAILDGRKTVTRRVVKPQHLRVLDSPYHREHPETPGRTLIEKLCEPPYRPGDILYVRETWAQVNESIGMGLKVKKYIYRANYNAKEAEGWKWRPSIRMPREAARIWLRVTDVRVERLQDCGNAQASDEGCTCCSQFARIWDSTIKPADREKYGWTANPWVWAIEFERCEKPEATET